MTTTPESDVTATTRVDGYARAAMSCCPFGAIAILGVGVDQAIRAGYQWYLRRRVRHHEIAALRQMWEADCASPPAREI